MLARSDLALGIGQGLILATVLMGAVFGPRSGQPAMLIPLSGQGLADAFAFAAAEETQLMDVDADTGLLIVIAPATGGLMRAVMNGFLPVAADSVGCADTGEWRLA